MGRYKRQKVEEALLDDQKAARDVRDAARAEGLPPEAARDRLRPLEERFQEELTTFLPAADAESLVRTLTAPQDPPPRGRLRASRCGERRIVRWKFKVPSPYKGTISKPFTITASLQRPPASPAAAGPPSWS